MKRFHVHVTVEKLEDSIRFYSNLFDSEPSVVKPDYAKWMLDDPRVNFAISQRGHDAGLNHLGIQVDSTEGLETMRERLDAADAGLLKQGGAACCYARSDKHWVTDPSGIAWESFHTLGELPVFGDDTVSENSDDACCIPLANDKTGDTDSACCVPAQGSGSSCCG